MFICNFYKIGGVLCKMYSARGKSHASRFRREARREQQSRVGFNQPDECVRPNFRDELVPNLRRIFLIRPIP